MAEPISIQQLKDASEDAITLADFIYKPANVMIPRRLAADINSLQYYLDYMSSYAQHSYETYDEMVANAVNLPKGVSAFVTNDLDTAKNGIYTYNGVSFIRGDYQPEKAAKDFVESRLGGLEVFNGKVRAQDVSTSDGGTQADKNTKLQNDLDALPFDNGTLADTFVTVEEQITGEGALSLRDFNSKAVLTVNSMAELLQVKATAGRTVFVKGLQGGTFVYDSNKSSINDGVVIFNGWVRQINGIITPFMAGAALDDPTKDSSSALNKAIAYAVANKVKLTGLSKTFACSNVLVPSNLDFRDAFLQCSIFNVDNTQVLRTKISTSFDNPTKDVYMENIIIDGKRSLHTNIGNAGDGGRSGFAILDVCQDITLVNCKANNCVTDGFGFFPNGISFGTRNNMLNNVKLIDCEAHWNGRHGGSSDAENGLHFIRGKYQNNGKSLIEGAPYDTGNSGRLLEGAGSRMYGAGWDFETYTSETHMRDVILENVDMRYNSASSATFYRVHDPVKGVNNNIRIEGGKFNSAVPERAAIEFTTFNNESPIPHTLFDGVVIDGADMGGRSLVLTHTNAKVSNLINYSRLEVGGISNITLDKAYDNITNYTPETTKLDILSTKTKEPVLGKSDSDTGVKLHLSGSYGSKSTIDAMVGRGDKRGGIGFHISDNGGINTYFYNRNTAHTAITQEGSIFPQTNGIASLGNDVNRFKDIYLTNAPSVASDKNLKIEIAPLTAVEFKIATELKSLVKTYRLKMNSDKKHTGFVAQEVIATFDKYGLSAYDYNLLDDSGELYAIRYEELIIFILAAI